MTEKEAEVACDWERGSDGWWLSVWKRCRQGVREGFLCLWFLRVFCAYDFIPLFRVFCAFIQPVFAKPDSFWAHKRAMSHKSCDLMIWGAILLRFCSENDFVHNPDGKGWTRSWNLVILLLILITLKQTTACLLHMFQIISHFAKKKLSQIISCFTISIKD
jgi:hypothetical protein